MPLLHVRLFSDKTSISVPQGLRKAQFKLKGYRVLFTQDKHGYYHASVNTNLVQNGSVIAFTAANAPTSTSYDIPLLLDPDNKQTVYENCDWNLGMVDNLPSSIFFNITFFNCIQRTRFDRAFFNSNNNGFQNLFNNVSQGTMDVVQVNDYNGSTYQAFFQSGLPGRIGIKFDKAVPLEVGHSVVFNRSWCNEIIANARYYVAAIPTPLGFVKPEGNVITDQIWGAEIQVSATPGGTYISFSSVEDTFITDDVIGIPTAFSFTTPAVVSQASINQKFDKTPLYPYLPGSDYVLGYKYNPQGKIIEGTGLLTNMNYYPSAGKYVNTGVHIYSNDEMEAMYDDTCISTDEVVQQVNSNNVIRGSGVNRNAIIYPYTVDLLFEYS